LKVKKQFVKETVVLLITTVIMLSTISATANKNKTNPITNSIEKSESSDIEILFENSFESYFDFILQFPPWTQIDVDEEETIGLGACDFPNEYYEGSFIIFNPSMTVPPLDGASPHSGSKFAACFHATVTGNDDWMITPQLNADEFDEVSFWARTYSVYYNPERIQVGISTTGTNITDFTVISPLPYVEVPTNWTEYSFDLSAYNGSIYIALHCISDNTVFLMVDDFCVTHVVTIPNPDLQCIGELNWDNVGPGETVNGEFTVSNVGEQGSTLDWKIERHPSWGTWAFEPESGTNLSVGNSTTVQVTVVAPLEKNKKYTGGIKVVNFNNQSDYCSIDSILKTPLAKISMYQHLPQFLQLLYHFSTKFFSYFLLRI